MNNELDQFEQSIKNSLDGLSMPYNEQAWDKLSDALNKEITVSSSSGSSFNSGILAGLAATVLTLVGINVSFVSDNIQLSKQHNLAQTIVVESTKDQPSVISVAPIISEVEKKEAISTDANSLKATKEEISEVELKHVVLDEDFAVGFNDIENNSIQSNVNVESNFENSPELNDATILLELASKRICLGESPQVVVTSNQLLEEEQLWINGELVDEPITLKRAGLYSLQTKGRIGSEWFESNKEELLVVKAPQAIIDLQKWNDDFGRQRVRAEQSSSQVSPVLWDVNGNQFTTSSLDLALENAGEYQIQLVTQSTDGCLDTARTSVYVNAPYNLLAPTAFTPNGDGRNDTWFPRALIGKSVPFEVEVKDKSGNTVFVSKDPNQVWDGGQAQVGDVFAWTAVVYFKEAEASTYHGTVFIVE